MLHPDLRAARFIPNVSWNLGIARLIRRLPMPRVAVPDGMEVHNLHLPGHAGAPDVRVLAYRPTDLTRPAPALLWIHGGGYVTGRPEQDNRACFEFARRLRITVVAVDYRLSPEHPFPAALDDAHAALTWLARPNGEFAVDPERIAVGGASAGGGLAAALAHRIRDEGRFRLAFQLLVYPMLDDRTVLRADAAPSDLRVWTPGSNRFGWTSYLGTAPGAPGVPEYAVPARRVDLTGLPPAWIGVGSADLFKDEDIAYATRLRAAGVPCALRVVDGAFHGFDAVFRSKPVTREFIAEQFAAMSAALGVRLGA